MPLSSAHAALCTRRRVASMRIAISASIACTSWWFAIGVPNVLRSFA